MHSIRTKITVLTVCEIIVVVIITGILGVAAISDLGNDSSNQILYLLCEDGERNLDSCFKSVEQSVKTVSSYAEEDLASIEIEDLEIHLKRVEEIFEKTANHTNGVLTYYYRIDPNISTTAKGFWYVNLDGTEFKEHEVTDITLYDTEDQSNLVWFTVPKATGSSVWLPPYFTDNLDVYVFSYNVPVYKDNVFIGVIGIEIDYNTIAAPVNNIQLYDNGYAFICDTEGYIIYHPRMDMTEFTGGNSPKVPEGMKTESTYINYSYNNIKKQAVQLPLHNGMRLVVTVPKSEINKTWQSLLTIVVPISLLLILIAALFTMRMAGHITLPLRKLTRAAEQVDAGNYDFDLDCDQNDEVGILSRTFEQLAAHLKVQIKELNDLAYSDPLTSVHNKGAFDSYVHDLQNKIDNSRGHIEFAIGMFDCNDLKYINDKYGHIKGDVYLKASATVICRSFSHSPVFRIGGDEFAVILQNKDYRNRKWLIRLFEEKTAKTISENAEYKQVKVAYGFAEFNPKTDKTVDDVFRRADSLMYENKRNQKGENI